MASANLKLQLSSLLDGLEEQLAEIFEAEVRESEERADKAEEMAVEHEAEAREADARARAVYDLLRDLVQDRHEMGRLLDEEGLKYEHHGTLRTCPDRLCSEAAELLK